MTRPILTKILNHFDNEDTVLLVTSMNQDNHSQMIGTIKANMFLEIDYLLIDNSTEENVCVYYLDYDTVLAVINSKDLNGN